ncbi:MAG: bifunctional riboflavin kinase/FAD synthetase [Saprospiraceae bacterium]|nr:bifunctional riboflavin kinase/FAD synthetase [Saprospiraceae bacterium]
MKVLYFGKDSLPEFRNAVITIGAFDGFHKAHQDLIQIVCSQAQRNYGQSVVITFDPHPKLILDQHKENRQLLSTIDEKIQLLSQTNLDYLVIVPFNFEFSQQMPEEYVENFLIRNFKPQTLIIGFDHRFGINSTGDIQLLKQYSDAGRFQLIEFSKKEENHAKISSSSIRKAIQENNFSYVTQHLGRPYCFQGSVVRGRQVGTRIGYPTANLELGNIDKLIPNPGIYAALASYNNTDYDAMLYIGSRPTLGENLKQTIEIHLINFEGYIYGENLEVKIVSFIRPDQKFDHINNMVEQIKKDHVEIELTLSKFHLTYPNIKKNPSIAVAILNYNGESLLRKYIPGVFSHLPSNTTLYVIDNASTDDSLNFLKYNYPEIKRIALQTNYGFAEGYNKGLGQINADYFLLLNSDVEVKSDFITPLLHRIQADPYNMAVQGKIKSLDEPDKYEYAGAAGGLMDILGYTFAYGRMLQNIETDSGQYNLPREIFWSSGASMLINAAMFKSIGGFDVDYFAHQEEVDLCWRIQRAGGKIWFEPRSEVYHLGGGTLEYSQPNKLFLNFKNNLSTIFKNVPYYYLIFLLPVRFILDSLIAIKYLLSGNLKLFSKVVEAYMVSILSTFYLMYKKDAYNLKISSSSIGDGRLKGLLRGSLFIHYYFFNNTTVKKINEHYIQK